MILPFHPILFAARLPSVLSEVARTWRGEFPVPAIRVAWRNGGPALNIRLRKHGLQTDEHVQQEFL